MAALALASGMGVLATRNAEGASDDGPVLPSDAASFGFVVPGHASGVPLLESTKPFSLALSNGPVHGVPPTNGRLATASAIVSRELAQYPVAFLRGVRLAGIVLTEDLAESETRNPVAAQRRRAAPPRRLERGERSRARALHHEVFHFLQSRR